MCRNPSRGKSGGAAAMIDGAYTLHACTSLLVAYYYKVQVRLDIAPLGRPIDESGFWCAIL